MNDCPHPRPLAVVTAAAAGLGFEVARCCARQGFDLLVAAEDATIEPAGALLREHGTSVQTIQADLASPDGAGRLANALGSRPVQLVVANAGHGLDRVLAGAHPVDPDPVVKAHLKGTVELLQQLDRSLRAAPRGQVLVLGSMGSGGAGPFQALCHGTRLFLEGFSDGLRQDFEDSSVTVTCCLPARLGLVLVADAEDRTARLARAAFEATMRGDPDVSLEPPHSHRPLRVPAAAWRGDSGSWRASAG